MPNNFDSITKVLLLLSINSIFLGAVNGQQAELKRQINNHQVPRLEAAATIDAKLDDAVWKQALKVNLNYETDPGENTTPPVKTEVFIYENGETLFVAFNALDDNPEQILDHLTDRDNVWNSDFVGIKFDTFNEKRKAFQFFVNALGVQGDAIQEDFRGDDSNWDALWDSAGQVTETGYVVEMAIPFKSLRFPESDGEQRWGVEMLRFYPREFRHRIANTPVDRDHSCRVCQFDNLVGFKEVKPSQNLLLTPTLVVAQSDTREDAFTPWNEGDVENEFGLDLRYGITQDIYLNATLNPDFSQVEADAAQLDINNPFSLFLEEKRPFFLDGADYFNTNRRLVHTRNIAAPDYGLKVTGQSNGHSFGAIAVNDEQTNILIPSSLGSSLFTDDNRESKNQVLRYSYDLGNKSNVGFIHTERRGDDYKNKVSSVDAKYWFDQYHSLTFQYMSSDTKNPQALIDEFSDDDDFNVTPEMSGDALVLELNHNSRNWWGYLDYVEFDKDFRADLGFIGRVDFNKIVIGAGHRWFPERKDSWWSRINLAGDWDRTENSDGLKLEEEIQIGLFLAAKLQSEFVLDFGKRESYWNGEYFDETFNQARSSFRPYGDLKLSLRFDWGDKIDFLNTRLGEEFRYRPQIDWQVNRHWFTSLDYIHVDFEVPDGDLFTARLSNFRLTYQMNIRSFLRLTVQNVNISRDPSLYIDEVDATTKSVSSQLLYSYKINPQTLFFAGYSDAGYQDDEIDKIEQTGRSLFMKFSYAWQL